MTENQAAHILIVDDEAEMRELLCDLIETAGLRATAVEDGAAMRAELETGGESGRYSLLILDLRLRREDGLTLARGVRATSAIPIMILTGKGDETDRILGLELAADDYLMKPFNPRELQARVRALLRRAGGDFLPFPPFPATTPSLPGAPTARDAVRFGEWMLDFTERTLRTLHTQRTSGNQRNQVCALTPSEFALLEIFARNADRVLTRDHLLEHLRGQQCDAFDRTIDVLILRLRRKIERNPAHPEFILTERGIGYVFRTHSERE